MKSIAEPRQRVPVLGEFDVVVCGGGAAGYCAAIAAARAGASILLVERGGFLGGSATQSLVLPLMTFHASPTDQIVKGIGEEIVRKTMELGGSPGHMPDPLGCAATITPADPETLKWAIHTLVKASGTRLLLHCLAVAPILKGRRLRGIFIEGKSGRQAALAKVIVDATGDGDIAARAGAPFTMGRASDGKTQPLTLMFRMGSVDIAAVRRHIRKNPSEFVLPPGGLAELARLPLLAVSGFFKAVRRAQTAGELGPFRDRLLFFEMPAAGEVLVNMTRVIGASGTDAAQLTRGELEALEQTRQIVRFLRKRVPGFSAASLIEVASQIGVRETRHIEGRYTLTAEDVLAGRAFDDSVARGAFPIDLHSPDGAGLVLRKMAPGASYGIPYRCLLPVSVEGLLVTGRAISATHEASASARLSPTCMALGQAAGLAAAMAARRGLPPSRLNATELRAELIKQGAIV